MSTPASQVRRAHTLRWYMSVGFLLVAVCPLLLYGAQRVSALFTQQNTSIQDKHQRLAQVLAQAVDAFMRDQTAALESTARQIASSDPQALAHLNDAAFPPARLDAELAAAHSAQPAVLQLYVGNLRGRAVAADPSSEVGRDFSQFNYVRQLLSLGTGATTYSNVLRGPGSADVSSVVIAVPLIGADRALAGYLAGTVDLQEVQTLSASSQVGHGDVVVVDSQGRVIAAPHPDWRLQARDLSSLGVFQQAMVQGTGVAWFTNVDGVPTVAGFASVPQLRWRVWVSQPVAELRAELSPLIMGTLQWLLVAVVLALVLAFLATAWLSRPVAVLNKAAARMATGDFSAQAVIRDTFAARELLGLAETFNQMATQLSGAYQTLEEKVSQRTSELQAANQELARANKLKSEFLANVSHELRTPLSAIIGFSQILLDGIDGALNEEQQQDIAQVNKSGQSLLGLINQILDLSKIEAGKMEISTERVELADVVGEVLDEIRPLAQEKGLRIESRLPAEVPAVEADPVRLRQILINLLSNAVKFTDRGHLEVWAQPSGRMVRVSVRDTGVGITPESQKVIFDEFVQGDGSSTRRHGGTGLGLSIVRKLVEMHGGAITVVSEPGLGSTFTFTLPAWSTAPLPAPVIRPRAVAAPARGPGGRAVLVVDDDPGVRQLIARQLEQEGWRVIQAGNASDAVQLARESQPVLVTLDIMMPDASGWWVLEHLKEDPRTSGIPVLVVSIVEEQHKVFALGASDYLSKPYDRRQLIERIKRLLPDLRGKRVLVVDDEADARSMLGKILAEEGAEVSQAGSGAEALSAVERSRLDLVLLDLMMPGMSGFEAVARLRANPATSSLPVVIVTAKEMTAEDMRTLSGHVQRFITKGELDPAGLRAAVRQVLGQASQRREAAA